MVTSQGKGQYAASAPTEKHVGITSRLYKPDGTKRAVIWCHSAGGDATEPVIATNNTLPLLQAVTDLGLPIISADFSGLAWGNDAAQARVTDALAYARTAFGAHATLPPILLGVSMGGLLSLNWARANPTLVRALALMYPVTNLQAMHDGTGGIVGNAATSTEAAYGGNLAGFNAAVATHNPAQNTSAYTGVPIKIWYSTADTTVGTANQTAFISAVGGSNLTTVTVGAAAHADMTQIPPAELAAFVSTYA